MWVANKQLVPDNEVYKPCVIPCKYLCCVTKMFTAAGVPHVWYIFQEVIHVDLSYVLVTSLTCRTTESQMKHVSLWHILHYASGHVMKAGHQNIGPPNDANFSPCSVSAVGCCDVMQLSGGDADSAWASWHCACETHRLSGCISTTKQAMSLCLSYFSFHVPFPPVKGLTLGMRY